MTDPARPRRRSAVVGALLIAAAMISAVILFHSRYEVVRVNDYAALRIDTLTGATWHASPASGWQWKMLEDGK